MLWRNNLIRANLFLILFLFSSANYGESYVALCQEYAKIIDTPVIEEFDKKYKKSELLSERLAKYEKKDNSYNEKQHTIVAKSLAASLVDTYFLCKCNYKASKNKKCLDYSKEMETTFTDLKDS